MVKKGARPMHAPLPSPLLRMRMVSIGPCWPVLLSTPPGGGIWGQPARVREQVCAGLWLAQGGAQGGGGHRHPVLWDAQRPRAQHAGPRTLGLQGE